MLNPSFSDLLKNGESKYTLVMVAAKRARQIIDGSKPLVETSSSKPVTSLGRANWRENRIWNA